MATLLYSNLTLQTMPADPKDLINSLVAKDLIAHIMKAPVRVVATSDLAGTYTSGTGTLVLGSNGALTVDSVNMVTGDRVLLAGQTTATQNGVYVVQDTGSASTPAQLTRAEDCNTSDLIFAGMWVTVTEGTLNMDTDWQLTTNNPITLDMTALAFAKKSGGGTVTSNVDKYIGVYTGVSIGQLTVTHNLNNTFPTVQVYDTTNKTMVLCDVQAIDNNSLYLTFGAAPGDITVIAVG